MSRSSSSTRERDHHIRQTLSKGLEKASCATLTDEEFAAIEEMIIGTPNIAVEILEPDIQSFSGTIEFNPILFREIILPLLLSSSLREE
jgi:hypothetical protein